VTVLAIDDPRWSDFVGAQSDATIFHHPVWAKLLADSYGYRAMAVALSDGGALVAGLPVVDVSLPLGRRRWVSLPFTDHCPPLAGVRGAELAGALSEVARASRLDRLEIRAPLGEEHGIQSHAPFVLHQVAVTGDVAATWKGLRRNHRRSVADAEEAGVRVVRGESAADVETFYRLHLQTRRRLGVPVQPRRFFALLLERVIRTGLGFVLTAHRDNVPVAGALFCAWNGTVMCKYSARADGFTKIDAIHLLFWSAIRWACENGYHTFDLGRSEVQQTQLRSFKDGWGARETPLAYSWIASAPVKLGGNRSHELLGVLIRNSAPWLCRATGELLYRYAT